MKIRKKNGRHYVRFVDADTKRETDLSCGKLGLTTDQARRAWAIRKSRALAARNGELALGAPTRPQKDLHEALDELYQSTAQTRSPNTVKRYRATGNLITVWAKSRGIQKTDAIGPVQLADLSEYFCAARKRRGAARPAGRSAATINADLRHAKAMLNRWRAKGLVPLLTRDAVSDGLRPVPMDRPQPVFFRTPECIRILRAAQAHDQETFGETRAEHRGDGTPGATLRYTPIAPFVLFMMMTGLRKSEALALEWSDVHLGADHLSSEGELRLRSETTKWKRARTVGLEVSPALHLLLKAMRLRAGDAKYVFGSRVPLAPAAVDGARKRLYASYGAPSFTWKDLRSNCASFLTNAAGIYGAASVFRSCAQLGHSVRVAETHYVGLIRNIDRDARTLEGAMRIEDVARDLAIGASHVERHSEATA